MAFMAFPAHRGDAKNQVQDCGGHTVIKEGEKAPDFELKDHFGREISLSQYRGKRHVLLLFYPLDFTPT